MLESKFTEQFAKYGQKAKHFGTDVKGKTKALFDRTLAWAKKSGAPKTDNTQLHHKFHKKIINKTRFYTSLGCVAAVLMLLIFFYVSGKAYILNINGKDFGKVRNAKAVQNVVVQLQSELKATYKTEVNFIGTVSYKPSRASDKELMTDTTIREVLQKNLQVALQSYVIYVNGNKTVVMKDDVAAKQLLDGIKANYTKGIDTSKLKDISFYEKVEVKLEFAPASQIMKKDEALAFILKGTSETKTHKIASGESFWTIARKYKMSTMELAKANPGVNAEKVKIGQVISLVVPKPLISVKTVETAKYTDKVPFDQEVAFSESMYKNQTEVKIKGEYGEKEVTADVIKVNGIEKERKVVAEKQTKAPRTQVIMKGTKDPPPRIGSGKFSMPTRGSLTSRFGYRWGREHEGIDLAAPYGSAVRASDGGKVVFVGYSGGYGKLIKVDHGNGYVTFYGHLSKYNVKVGQRVAKRDKIGFVGSTGHSTGPHVHFEIRKFGVALNPMKFLR